MATLPSVIDFHLTNTYSLLHFLLIFNLWYLDTLIFLLVNIY